MGAGWGNDVGLVFTQPDGTPLHPQTITASFKRISLDLDLPTIGVHGLRQSSATMMLSSGSSEGGQPAPRTQHRRDHVGHVLPRLPAHDQAAANVIGRALDEASQTFRRDSVTNR